MGALERVEGGARYTLGGRCLLGRHPGCDVRVEDGRVSGEHASLHWREGHWELRDLGSRNGTYVEGRRLEATERVVLGEGALFVLGRGGVGFRLVEAGPPTARARQVASGEVRVASGTLLVLPDDESPQASLFVDEQGRWVLEQEHQQRLVEDQQRLWVGGQEWVVEVPLLDKETLEEAESTLDRVHLQIGISRNEEHVQVTVVYGGRQQQLPERSHHYLLATLARVWLAEQHLPEPERGWVDRERLCRMLATDANKLNVDIHRARKQLSTLGIQDAAGLVQRRHGSGELRLGIRSVEVSTL
jgi:pSer/pThr/pTyr-binding forkhead associated (FHA) protein